MDYKYKYLKYKKKYLNLKYGGINKGAHGEIKIIDCNNIFPDIKCNKAVVKSSNSSNFKHIQNECNILKKLNHDNIVSFYGCEDNKKLYIEYSELGSLRDNIKKLNNRDKINIINGLVSGLIYLHENKIIHRDIKPENIVLFKKDNIFYPKIIDFGISNTKRIFSGTRSYMNNYPSNIDLYICKDIIDNSKQSYKKEECYKKYDSKVMNRLPILRDYYGLGCVIFEIIYGKKYQVNINGKPKPNITINSNGNKLLEFIMNLLNNSNFILPKITFQEKDLPSSTNNIITNTPAKTLTRTAIFSPTKLLSPGIKRNIKPIIITPKKLKM